MSYTIDLRSDTVTLPSKNMIQAMVRAEMGDDGRLGPDGRGEDPTVNELEALAASVFEKEDALFMPTGTMGNMVALMVFCRRGDSVLIGKHSHIRRIERGIFHEDVLGLQALEVDDRMGYPQPEEVEFILGSQTAKVLCLENTHNAAGGSVINPEVTRDLVSIAHSRNIPVHLDGARVFNAAIALNMNIARVVEGIDSVMFSLSKALSAPIGAILTGPREYIKLAREKRKLLGGQMRQVGMLAAAGVVALNTMVEGIHEDHEKARRLAAGLAEVPGICLDPETVKSNIVKADVSGTRVSATQFQSLLANVGVLVSTVTSSELRFVAHKDVSLDDIDRALTLIYEVSSSLN